MKKYNPNDIEISTKFSKKNKKSRKRLRFYCSNNYLKDIALIFNFSIMAFIGISKKENESKRDNDEQSLAREFRNKELIKGIK